MDENEKLGIVVMVALYEMILTKKVGDETKNGLTIQILLKENLYYEFALLMADFEKKLPGFELEPGLNGSCRAILQSWNQYHISPEFTKILLRILREDADINNFIRSFPIAGSIIELIGRRQ